MVGRSEETSSMQTPVASFEFDPGSVLFFIALNGIKHISMSCDDKRYTSYTQPHMLSATSSAGSQCNIL